LLIKARNFIVHFREHADEEWYSDNRDEIIEIIQSNFNKKEEKGLPVFGVSS
jgi:uncharacterized protein (DUF2461 family)